MATERHTHEKQHLPVDAVSEELRMLRYGKTRTFSFFPHRSPSTGQQKGIFQRSSFF